MPFKALNRCNIRLKTLNVVPMGWGRNLYRPPHRRCGFQPHRRLRKPAPFKALNRRNIRLKTLNVVPMGWGRNLYRPPHRRCGFQPHRRLRKLAPFKALNRRNIRLKTLNLILMLPSRQPPIRYLSDNRPVAEIDAFTLGIIGLVDHQIEIAARAVDVVYQEVCGNRVPIAAPLRK